MTALRHPLLLLTLLCALLYLPGIADLPPFDRDEARFAQASKQMLDSGDWLVPHFQDEPRSKKPAGIYWLQSGSVALFSSVEAREIWAYRVPSAIGAWLSVLLTFAIGRRLFDPRTALFGAALLGSSLLLVAEAHLAKTDAVLLATILLALWGLSHADRGRGVDQRESAPARGAHAGVPEATTRAEAAARMRTHPLAWLGFWGGLGLGGLIKGPIGPAVVGLTVLGLRLLRGRWPSGRVLRPLPGLALAVVLAGAWPAALWATGDIGFILASAHEDLIPKILSGQESHGAPPGTYLLALYPSFWPASLLVIPAVVAAFAHRRERGAGFCLAWAVPAWLLFALVPTKLPHYVLPTYPALALLAGAAIVYGWGRAPTGAWRWLARLHVAVWGLLGLGFVGALAAIPHLYAGAGLWWSLPVALATLAGVAAATIWLWQGRRERGAAACVALSLLVLPWIGEIYGPRLDHLWVAREVAERIPPAEARPPLAATGFHEPSLVFLNGTDTNLTTPRGVAAHLAQHPDAYGLVTDRTWTRFQEAAAGRGLDVERIASFPGFNYSNGDPMEVRLVRRTGAQ